MIDSHAHLEMPAFDRDRPQVLSRAREAGISAIVSLALIDEQASYRKALDLVGRHSDLYTAIGCHPHDAKIFGEDGEARLGELLDRPRLLAIGEIGLDYHYNLSPPEVQRDVFRRQIRVAREHDLPVIIHQREAQQDLIPILDEEKAADVGGILHSFTADLPTARAAIERGFLVSFSGILTFKGASSLREVAKALPLDKLLVETDCPYLAPVPLRGKRNEPAFIWETTRVLAEARNVLPRDVERATEENFRRFFRL